MVISSIAFHRWKWGPIGSEPPDSWFNPTHSTTLEGVILSRIVHTHTYPCHLWKIEPTKRLKRQDATDPDTTNKETSEFGPLWSLYILPQKNTKQERKGQPQLHPLPEKTCKTSINCCSWPCQHTQIISDPYSKPKMRFVVCMVSSFCSWGGTHWEWTYPQGYPSTVFFFSACFLAEALFVCIFREGWMH